MRIEKGRIDEVAKSLNSHPGISHNYQRNDVFNLWFTLAVPPAESIEKTFEFLKSRAGAEEALFLPAIHIYKIGVRFELDEELPDLESEQLTYIRNNKGSGKISLTKTDIALVRVMQEDLPVIEMPFAVLAEQAGLSEEELFNWSKHALQTGLMRRFCAVLYHRNVGMKANAMVVWRVPEENINSVGEEIAKFRQVSHCYRRPTTDIWPYSIFSMIHGSDEPECSRIIGQIEQKIGSFPHKVLLSVKEYKKVRIKYFDPEFDAWRSRFSDKANKNERRRK
jgi:DNA-binding Lrp family transcriptional regulator